MTTRTKLKTLALLVLIAGEMMAVGWFFYGAGEASAFLDGQSAGISAAERSIEEFKQTAKLQPQAELKASADKDIVIAGCGTFAAGMLFCVLPTVTVIVAVNVIAVFAVLRSTEPLTTTAD
jgi:hypothetical protein